MKAGPVTPPTNSVEFAVYSVDVKNQFLLACFTVVLSTVKDRVMDLLDRPEHLVSVQRRVHLHHV